MPYGNNNVAVRGFNTLLAVTWKGFLCCVLGPGLLYLDIASGANYFQKAFEPYVNGNFDVTIPWVGWHIDWAKHAVLGFVLSAILSGMQVMLWNWVKSAGRLRDLKPQHLVAVLGGLGLLALDVMSDLGGATIWVSDTVDGRLWPIDANMFQKVTIPVIVMAGLLNEAFMDYFFGIDKPMDLSKLKNVLPFGRKSNNGSSASVAA